MRAPKLLVLLSALSAGFSLRAVAADPADALLAKMTLEQKVGQLAQAFYFGGKALESEIRSGQLGSVATLGNPETINRLQRIAVEESPQHIPLLFGLDVIHGYRTIFPVPLALAASWDPEMVTTVQAAAAAEARAAGVQWTFAPMVDIARDPRWGRMVEGAGEDPYLGAAMAAAQVRGFQGGAQVQPGHVLASVKHFAGYGAPTGGRDYEEVNLSPAELWNVYLPPFKAAVGAGAAAVMSAYMDLNGVPATGNRWLLTDVLRKTWHFDGFVISDADAVRNLTKHGFASDPDDAAIRALTAGLDMEMSIGKPITPNLVDSVRKGRVSQKLIDKAARRILQAKFNLGLFKDPFADETHAAEVLQSPQHRDLARAAAERSAVLLRNESSILPLDRTRLRSIAVIGPYADSQRDTLGPWAFDFNLEETRTIAAAVRDQAGASIRVEVAPGVQRPMRRFPSPFLALDRTPKGKPWTPEQVATEFAKADALARASDVVVLVLGEGWDMSGEAASVDTLALAGDQQRLLEAMLATGKPVVLVLLSGRPLEITAAAEHAAAILEAWFPGTQGGTAVANLLFGDAVPGGKLPFTWPRTVGQVPLFYAHTASHEPHNAAKRYWNEDGSPLYPFGYGLSYTTFSFSEPHIEHNNVRLGTAVTVSLDVTNTGTRAGDEVVQLYIHQRSGRASRPVRELKGFRRLTLAPAESRQVTFTLTPADLQYWSTADSAWVQDPATFDVWIGGDSNATAHAQFDVHR